MSSTDTVPPGAKDDGSKARIPRGYSFRKPASSNSSTHTYNLPGTSSRKPVKRRYLEDTDGNDSEALTTAQRVVEMTDVIKALWLSNSHKRRTIDTDTGPGIPASPALPQHKTVRTTFLLVSDTHGIEPAAPHDKVSPFRTPLPHANVFIHAGDLTCQGSLKALKRAVRWISKVPAEVKILIAGNHDWRLDEEYWIAHGRNEVGTDSDDGGDEKAERGKEHRRCREYLMSQAMKNEGIYYLENEVREFTLSTGAKFTVLASPYTPRGAHPHNGGSFRYEPTTKHYWHKKFPLSGLPEQVHVAITHTPPYKMQDQVSSGHNVGCPELLRFLRDVRPLLSVCGHIHEAAGAKMVTWERLDDKGGRTALAERDLRPETQEIQTPEGEGGTRGLAVRSPVMVELELPYTKMW
ncbi:hypothetical protein ABW21_db0207515 [Orbilia brochopaga]|nr:hypothetical protein ABW21_db0207515 [Drechslerella brochopaga]